jgi:predicted phage tail protein
MSDRVNLNVNSGELTTIRMYGRMGKLFGRVRYMAVSSAAEAVAALCSQLPGFERYLTEAKDNGYGFAVFYGKSNLRQEDLANPSCGDEIRFAPILFGSKEQGWFNVIVGVLLVVVGVVLTVFGMGIGAPLIKMGVALIAGGVVQMLAPAPKGLSSRDRPENTPSYAFNGPINTQAQGNPVMVVYGECIAGSAVLSAGINAVDQAYVPRGPGAGSGGSGGGGAPPWHENWNATEEG